MDFRTCPACKASILEDDADDCPFCGASLSGKASKPKPAPPAAKSTASTSASKPTATAASKGASGKPAPTRRTEPDEEESEADPFEVDTSAVRDAHPISTKRTKTTPMPVTCPMCETSGFISPKLAGKEVKCCNPDCMVPVFKAPPLPKKEEVVVEAPQGMSTASKITMGVIGLFVLIGGGIAYSIITGEDENGGPSGVGPRIPVATDSTDPDDPGENVDHDPVEPGGPKYTLEQIQTDSVAEMERQAQRTSNNRSPPFGRQAVAEVQFILGNDSAGRDELTQLRAASRGKLYFQIAPLAELAWRHFDQGDDASANAVLDEALTAAANLPTVSRQSLDDATVLCAALCRAERWDDALRIARPQRTLEPRGRTSALWRGALEFKTFDISEEYDRPYLMDMPDSLAVAVTRTLVARGDWEDAWMWTTKVDGVDVRANCQAAWAGALTIVAHRTNDTTLLAKLDGTIGEAEPVAQARMWAAVADGHRLFDKTTEAEAALAKGVEVLAAVPVPSPPAVPSMQAIFESKGKPFAGLADPAPLRSLALAWADIGQTHFALEDADAAWGSFALSLDALRGTTPSPALTQSLVDECDSQEAQVKSRLAAAGITDPNRTGFYQYRGQCTELNSAAGTRFQEQVSLLTRAVNLGLVDPAWNYIKEHSEESLPLEDREAWRTSSVPNRIVSVASRTGSQAVLADVRATIVPFPRPTALDDLHYYLPGVNETTTIDDISDWFNSRYPNSAIDDDVLDAMFLDIVAEVCQSRGIAVAFELAGKSETPRPTVVEDAFRLLSARAIISGRQDDIWDAYLRERGKLSVTEKIAIFRGLIDGILVVRDNENP